MKSDLIDRRISELENELAGLRRRKVAQLQEELSKLQSDLNGTRPAKASKGWASDLVPSLSGSSTSGKSGGRGKRLSDDEVVERLRKVVAASGSEGISARAAAEQAGVFYLRAIKTMGDAFVKTGSGKWTRYTIK
jgi:hypothetical protein